VSGPIKRLQQESRPLLTTALNTQTATFSFLLRHRPSLVYISFTPINHVHFALLVFYLTTEKVSLRELSE